MVRVRDREAILSDFKRVYRAMDLEEAHERFEEVRQRWERIFPRLNICLAKSVARVTGGYGIGVSHSVLFV